jgi:glycosyltransferase involved in cell wall biosynthesis
MENSFKPIKIAILLHSDGLEGAGRSHIENVTSLIEAGNEVFTLLPQSKSDMKSTLIQIGSEVHVVGDLPWWTSKSNLSLMNLVNINLIKKLIILGPDLIVTQTGVIPQAAIAAKILNVPHVWYLREYIDQDHAMRIPFAKEKFSKIVLELSQKVLTNSEEIAKYFYPAENLKVEVIYPISLDFKSSQLTKVSSKSLRLGVVGTISENKGQVFAVEALRLLIEKGFDVTLEIYGDGDPAYRQILTDLIAAYDLEARIKLHGFVSDRSKIYSNIDVLLVTSKFEAFGRTVIEGMVNSIPVLISDTAAMAKRYSEMKICLDFESQNPNSLSKQIEKLVSDKDLWSKMTQNASKFVAKESSIEKSSRLNKVLIQAVQSYEQQEQDSDVQTILFEIYRLTEDHSRLTEDHSRLTEDHSRLTEDHSRLTEEIATIYSSEFWRATKPIRWFIGIISVPLRRIRKKG